MMNENLRQKSAVKHTVDKADEKFIKKNLSLSLYNQTHQLVVM